MGKLNFSNCSYCYNKDIFDVISSEDTIIIFYDFTKMIEKSSTLSISLNTIFIQNLALVFISNQQMDIRLDLRKGEQNFIYGSLTFNLNTSKKLFLEHLNPYTFTIDLTLQNNHTKGYLKLKKS